MERKVDGLAKITETINTRLLDGTDFEVEFIYEDQNLITKVFAGEDRELLATGYQDDQEVLEKIFSLDEFMGPLKMLEVATELAVKYCNYRKEVAEKFNKSVIKSRKQLFKMLKDFQDTDDGKEKLEKIMEELG